MAKRETKSLTDSDPCPYGPERGLPMEDVSASWLIKEWNSHQHAQDTPIAGYISFNLEDILIDANLSKDSGAPFAAKLDDYDSP